MPKTKTFTLTNATWVTPTAKNACARVMFREEVSVSGWPTTDLLIAAPTDTDTQIQWPAGAWTPIVDKGYPYPKALFAKDESLPIALKTVTGSTTIQQWEEP